MKAKTPVGIPVHHRGEIAAFALVDAEDAPWALQYRWSYAHGYAYRGTSAGGKKRTYTMSRELLGLEHGDPREADHINRDKLDNRRSNLRAVTHQQNKQNLDSYKGSTSRYRGVSWSNERNCWIGSIKLNGKRKHLGQFATEEEAAKVAAAARAELMPFSEEAAAA